jgi:hypothetical protein
MTDAETEHLFNLTRAASEGPRTSRAQPQSRLPRRAVQLIDTMPDVPAIALGRLGDVVGANALGRALFPHLFPENGNPLNHNRFLFLDDRCATSMSIGKQAQDMSCRSATPSSEKSPLGFETLTLASAPDIRIVVYLADPATPSADALDLLRSWVATGVARQAERESLGGSPS